MAWQDAVDDADDGCTFLLEVVPDAKRAAFPDGFNAWRGRIRIAVRAAAQDGKANEEVRAAVADFFAVPRAAVDIRSGGMDRRKRIAVAGVTAAQARQRLEARL